jgi:hypothetical protein
VGCGVSSRDTLPLGALFPFQLFEYIMRYTVMRGWCC